MSKHTETAREIEHIGQSIKHTVKSARTAIAGLDEIADAFDDIDSAFGYVIDVLDGMNDRLAKLESAILASPSESNLRAWLESGDTGISSRAMARTLAPLAGLDVFVGGKNDGHPHDPGDLGRCIRLLEVIPELRPHLPGMAGISREWAAVVGAWDELESLYRKELPGENAWRCYRRMREILSGVEIEKARASK